MRLEIKKHRMAQSTDGTWTVTFTLHPHDDISGLVAAPVGFRWYANLEEATDEETGGEIAELPKFAGVLCSSWDFQTFLFHRHGQAIGHMARDDVGRTELCARLLRDELGIASRKELATNKEAARRFLDIHREFKGWTA